MPALSALAIRIALLHLATGLTFGFLMLANKGVPFAPSLWRLLPAHAELLLVGWTVQLAFAVAHWIIPRFRGGDFGRLWLAKVALLLLNSGVLLVVVAAVPVVPAAVVTAGRLIEAAAVVAFALYIWPRVRPLGV